MADAGGRDAAPEPRAVAGRLTAAGAAARRLGGLLLAVAGLTAAASLLLGLLAGGSLSRALALGFYLVGCLLLLIGFFVGNRGPARPRSDTENASLLPFFGSRRLRWATREEQEEAMSLSAVFVTLGVLLLVLGVLVDGRHQLV